MYQNKGKLINSEDYLQASTSLNKNAVSTWSDLLSAGNQIDISNALFAPGTPQEIAQRIKAFLTAKKKIKTKKKGKSRGRIAGPPEAFNVTDGGGEAFNVTNGGGESFNVQGE